MFKENMIQASKGGWLLAHGPNVTLKTILGAPKLEHTSFGPFWIFVLKKVCKRVMLWRERAIISLCNKSSSNELILNLSPCNQKSSWDEVESKWLIPWSKKVQFNGNMGYLNWILSIQRKMVQFNTLAQNQHLRILHKMCRPHF